MTRQWLTHPEQMCPKHLVGEHAEAHSFVEKMRKGYSLTGFVEGSMFFGAEFVRARHNLLAKFIAHTTPLEITEDMKVQYPLLMPTIENILASVSDLVSRCPDCRNRHGM